MNSDLSNYDEPTWLSAEVTLPNVCCRCGMYTDQFSTFAQKVVVREEVNATFTAWKIIGGVVLSIFLGPLGWLISIFGQSSSDADEEGRVLKKKKIKIRLPICYVCRDANPPAVLGYQVNPTQFLISAHPRFLIRYQEAQSQAESNQKMA